MPYNLTVVATNLDALETPGQCMIPYLSTEIFTVTSDPTNIQQATTNVVALNSNITELDLNNLVSQGQNFSGIGQSLPVYVPSRGFTLKQFQTFLRNLSESKADDLSLCGLNNYILEGSSCGWEQLSTWSSLSPGLAYVTYQIQLNYTVDAQSLTGSGSDITLTIEYV